MARTGGAFRRLKDGVYYFRRRVPRDLAGAIGKTEIICFLGPSDRAGAQRSARKLAARYDEWFAMLRGGRSLSPHDTDELARIWFTRVLNRYEAARTKLLFDPANEKAKTEDDLAFAQQMLRDNNWLAASEVSEQLLAEFGFRETIDEQDPNHPMDGPAPADVITWRHD